MKLGGIKLKQIVFNYFKLNFVEQDKKEKENFNIYQLFSLYGSLNKFNSLEEKCFSL